MFCPPWCLSPTGPGLCHIPLPTSRPGHPGRREGAGKGLLGAGVRLGHRRLGPLASRSPGRLAAGSAERRPQRRGGFSETAGGPACSEPEPGSVERGPGRTQPPSRLRSSAPQVRRGRETHGVRDAAQGHGEAAAGGQPSPSADDPGALAGLPTGSRAQVWRVLTVRASGGAEGGAGRPRCRGHVGWGRPQSEPDRGPPEWLGRACPPALDRAGAPGNLCALEPGKGRATVGTLPAGPEEGGGSLPRPPKGLPAGCMSPFLQPPRPCEQPPTGTGPCVGNTRRGTIGFCLKGQGLCGEGSGQLAWQRPGPLWGAVRASWASSQGLGLLPHRRSLQAHRWPRGEVRVAGRGPAILQTPRQQPQPEAPVSA